jgi:hypothetical protein
VSFQRAPFFQERILGRSLHINFFLCVETH